MKDEMMKRYRLSSHRFPRLVCSQARNTAAANCQLPITDY